MLRVRSSLLGILHIIKFNSHVIELKEFKKLLNEQ